MFQGIKKILIVSVMVLMSSLTNSWAFDLEDYATTLRSSSQEYTDAQTNFKKVEAEYFKAFTDRLDVESAAREAQLTIEQDNLKSQDPNDQTAVDEASLRVKSVEEEIKKLVELRKLYLACPK